MNRLKGILRRIPLLPDLFRWLRRLSFQVRLGKKDCEQVFSAIYRKNYWGGWDSFSGTGSDVLQTELIVRELPGVFVELSVLTMLDIPCGDFHWMSGVELGSVDYTGADIVKELTEQNRKLYERQGLRFLSLDLIRDGLPRVDLVFCRDCLVHFSFKDIVLALKNICRSRSSYLLTTTFPERNKNHDIVTGQWRPLNLELPPFELPAPLKIIREGCTEGQGDYADKSMALWSIADIRNALRERFPE